MPDPVDWLTALDLEISEEASLHVITLRGEPADDELLRDVGATPFCCTDCEIPKRRPAQHGTRLPGAHRWNHAVDR